MLRSSQIHRQAMLLPSLNDGSNRTRRDIQFIGDLSLSCYIIITLDSVLFNFAIIKTFADTREKISAKFTLTF